MLRRYPKWVDPKRKRSAPAFPYDIMISIVKYEEADQYLYEPNRPTNIKTTLLPSFPSNIPNPRIRIPSCIHACPILFMFHDRIFMSASSRLLLSMPIVTDKRSNVVLALWWALSSEERSLCCASSCLLKEVVRVM